MLETRDLILDKARLGDWLPMYRNVWSRPETFRCMILEPTPSEAEARARMERTVAFQSRNPEAYTVFLRTAREAIGFANLNPINAATWEEGGICLGPDFWRRGYGWQILTALLSRAKALGAKEFIYSSWEENAASRAMAGKAGFTEFGREGHVREWDGRIYTLIKYRKSL